MGPTVQEEELGYIRNGEKKDIFGLGDSSLQNGWGVGIRLNLTQSTGLTHFSESDLINQI